MIKVNNSKELVLEDFNSLKSVKVRNTVTNEIKKFLYEEIITKKNKFISLTSDKPFRHYPITVFLRDELKIQRECFTFDIAPKSAMASKVVVTL